MQQKSDMPEMPPDPVSIGAASLETACSVDDLREVIDSSEDTLWAMDTCGRIISYNRNFAQRMLERFGVVVHPGIALSEVMSPELTQVWYGFNRRVQAEGVLRMEYAAASGGFKDLLLSPIVREGRFAGVSAFMRDITERKNIERDLKDSRDYIESLLESSADEVVSVDREMRVVAFNSNFSKSMLASNGVLPRKGMLISEIVPPERADRWPVMFQKTEEEGHCVLEYDIPGVRLLEASINVIRQNGEIIGFSSFARDITQRRRNERELEQLRSHLEQQVEERTRQLEQAQRDAEVARDAAESANRAKSRFLANMSHELRTPLNAILGFAELLSTDTAVPAEQQEMAGIISSSGEHLLAIINDILDLAKVESGKLELEPCDFRPRGMLDDLLRLLKVQATAKQLTLELDPASAFPDVVHIDPVRLRQVIVNLVGNAIKFTQEGGVTLAVDARRELNGATHLVVEVRDTGCGIASEDRERVFDPFVQLQVRPGTGLGLAITRRIVELMGGMLELESELGKGSTFRLSIPIGISASSSAPQQEGHILAVPGAEGKRILVVEDHPDNRRLMRIYLSSLGFQVREAEDAMEGICQVFAWEPDLVLMDRRLPGMDGLDAVREIRRRGARMPVVAVTAQAFAEDREAMLAAGCQSFLAKPVSGESLAWAVAQALGLEVERG